jgi:membrane protein
LFTTARILIRAASQWGANADAARGAALAYYALFSIAPLLVIAIWIAGMVFGEEAARGHVEQYLAEYIDRDSAKAIQGLVEHAWQSHASGLASALSLVALVFGALGSFLHLRASLAIIWKFEPPHGNTYLGMLLDYGLALVMVLFTGFLLLLSLVASVVVRFVRAYMEEHFPLDGWVRWDLLELATSFLFLALLFTAIYRILSGRRISWTYSLYGAITASILFTVGKTLLSVYLVYTGTASAYGAAGSIVVFLIWVYYSSQILFFCAEMIQARRTRGEWLAKRNESPSS